MNKGQFCLSMGKSDKSIWQLALIVSLKIERGKKSYYFFHVFMYSVYSTVLLARAMLGIWVPAPNASYHTHVHGSLGMSLVGIFGAKNIFGERLFSSMYKVFENQSL